MTDVDETIFDPSTHVYVPIRALEHVLEAARVHERFAGSVAVLEAAIHHGEPTPLFGLDKRLAEFAARTLTPPTTATTDRVRGGQGMGEGV